MPYPTNADLPPSVRSHLPEHAQEIYREAFNHAFAAHAGEARQEEAAHSNRVGGRQAFLRQGREQLDRPSPVISLRAISGIFASARCT